MIDAFANALSERATRLRASEIRELLKVLERPGMISFAGGIPDPNLFDREGFAHALAELAGAGNALQYSATEGYGPLRSWIAERMSAQGVTCGPEHILITSGSQQGLDLIGKLLLDPADTLAVARPTYLGALQCFRAYEPTLVEWQGAALPAETKALYLVPDFANPSGETLTLAQREAALDAAQAANAVVLEDAAYVDLRFEGEPLPSLLALDCARHGGIDAARTLYCGTFSKTLAPGLRVGWICAPRLVIDRLVLLKQGVDLHTATLNQMAMHRVALAGFDAQLVRACAVYRERRDAMLTALGGYAPAGMHWTQPEGGLFIWAELPEGCDSKALLASALEANVAFVPGPAFYAQAGNARTLRLSYSLNPPAEIEAGIRTLCSLIASHSRAAA
ncbi:PLP-dependent aminotransferase family protein [Achromobacter sp. GG226]|uniref:aminotransferase-like domain-containing protein n=1 Tax=Verticiella alkaliphila TaxID=2779529 RepID=UPI001C0CDE95|nr:PLP-dependent aminotransferase family protein [Verticiella sp. GG226]MBU4609000.1 PLP-dependent aminotransferase family protein [Verticiella sp. GG226]